VSEKGAGGEDGGKEDSDPARLGVDRGSAVLVGIWGERARFAPLGV